MNNRNGGGFVGGFGFSGGETGYDVADYLLGAPSNYSQSTRKFSMQEPVRRHLRAGFDRLRSNLTLNLGLRWNTARRGMTQNKIVALVSGLQSTQYQRATGLVYPGDPGDSENLGANQIQ